MSSLERLLVATRKGLFTVERVSGKWEVVDAGLEGENVSAVLPDPRDGALYAAIDAGDRGQRLVRSDDGGRTFHDIAVPTYPPKPAAQTGHGEVPWQLELVWVLESGGPDRPQRLWAGTVPGGLFRSDDRGESWQLLRSLWDRPERQQWSGTGMRWPGIHSIAVDPRDPDHVLIAISRGGVWRTRDAGESFTVEGRDLAAAAPVEGRSAGEAADVHRLVACRANPDVVWAQDHQGIARSEDGARTFTRLASASPSGFGFAVAAHPHDPLTAWFVPATNHERRIPVNRRLSVMQTRDGGKTFESKTRGLPDRFAYDLVYRHALDVDGSGILVGFGSTTGNLWISENGGDAFVNVSHHLPPIYAVRFATARLLSQSFEGRASVAPPPRPA